MSRREDKLEDQGYQFTGEFSSEYKVGKELMKAKAAVWRKRGYRAQVLSEVCQGRVTSSDGYSVYIKPRKPLTIETLKEYEARLNERLKEGTFNTEFYQRMINQLKVAVPEGNDYVITQLLHQFSTSLQVHPQA